MNDSPRAPRGSLNPADPTRTTGFAAASGWSGRDLLAAAALFGFALFTNIATVLNNAYAFGATLYDSTIFQTIIWRSGLALRPAPAVSYNSFFNTHISPINYIPDALSYFAPIDRMSYYGIVYGIVFGLLLLTVFAALRRLFNGHVVLGSIGTVLFYFAGEITNGQFEPHQEYASALFMIAFFSSWAMRRSRLAVAMIVLNAAVREDCGALLALPILLLALRNWWSERRCGVTQNTVRLFGFAAFSLLLSVVSFAMKLRYFNQLDVVQTFYYDAWPNSFAHLSVAVITRRLRLIIFHEQFLWLPGIVLCIAGLALRDLRLPIPWVAFFPYWIFNFFSKFELSATLGSYKAFPLILMLVWPAIIGTGTTGRRRAALGVLQFVVLLSAAIGWQGGVPPELAELKRRWLLQPETQYAEIYRMMEPRFSSEDLGRVRASGGVVALYPYSFPRFELSTVIEGREDEAGELDSLAWFAGDRDQAATDKWLAAGQFPYLYRVIGTKIFIASRNAPETMPSFVGTLEVMRRPAAADR